MTNDSAFAGTRVLGEESHWHVFKYLLCIHSYAEAFGFLARSLWMAATGGPEERRRFFNPALPGEKDSRV